MDRLTSVRASMGSATAQKDGSPYWSAAKKIDLVKRLGQYEDTGLTPEQIRQRGDWLSQSEKSLLIALLEDDQDQSRQIGDTRAVKADQRLIEKIRRGS